MLINLVRNTVCSACSLLNRAAAYSYERKYVKYNYNLINTLIRYPILARFAANLFFG